jgi:hypothetical protein
MPPEDWDEIHGFASPGELERFRRWIASALDEEALIEIPVEEPYSGSPMLDEHWYRAASGSVWRLVAPDPPFRGVFERVR